MYLKTKTMAEGRRKNKKHFVEEKTDAVHTVLRDDERDKLMGASAVGTVEYQNSNKGTHR